MGVEKRKDKSTAFEWALGRRKKILSSGGESGGRAPTVLDKVRESQCRENRIKITAPQSGAQSGEGTGDSGR